MGNGKQSIVQRQIHNHKYFNTQNGIKNRLTQEIGRRKKNKELKQEINQRI